ncbi:CLUMA_CG000120, isoform A, partial [Clunio marinus]
PHNLIEKFYSYLKHIGKEILQIGQENFFFRFFPLFSTFQAILSVTKQRNFFEIFGQIQYGGPSP